MNDLRVVALTHKNFPLETIGLFHIADDQREKILSHVKDVCGIGEIMYLSTCNRVEFIFTLPHYVCPGVTAQLLKATGVDLKEEEVRSVAARAERCNGLEAAEHLLNVASSLDSAIIGEREIITQLRKAYEESVAMQLSGDDLRLIVRQCIQTAKEVFTMTDLAKKPVSVVSIAWEQFHNQDLPADARVLLIGAGQIIRNFSKFLFENGYSQLTFANRTYSNALTLAETFGGKALSLDELAAYTEGFDALVSCTGSAEVIVTSTLYNSLLQGENKEKIIIDLALPADVDPTIATSHSVKYFGMEQIKIWANENLQFREKAIADCMPIIRNGLRDFEKVHKERQIEKAMISIPETIKDIRNTALGSVFAKDLETLDDHSREVLEKIVNYMEKKYISIPMKMAKDVLLDEVKKN
ncbi:MAG: glutamyl-tRNA reductase [Flavobacteriales bacterium]